MANNSISFVNMASCCCRSRVSQVLKWPGALVYIALHPLRHLIESEFALPYAREL